MFQFQATIDGVRTLKNNSLKISLETQDVNTFAPDEITELFRLNEKLAWVAIKEQPVRSEDLDIKEISTDTGKEKSPSRRLRSVLYVLWEQRGGPGEFELFYIKQMENFINAVKERLDK